MPTVSIIIPTYNSGHFLPQTLDSVFNQTFQDFEVVVIDDGSTDDTGGVISGYLDRVKYLSQTNQGPSAARNNGIRASKGEYLVFLDADDIVLPGKLESQTKALNEHLDWGVVYSAWQYINQSGVPIMPAMRPRKEGLLLKEWLLRSFFFPPGCALVRRNCLQNCGFFDEDLRAAEDTDLWTRVALAGYSFGYIDEVLFEYRISQSGLTSNYEKQIKNEYLRLDKFFAQPNLEQDILSLKPRAYAIVKFEAAARYYQTAEIQTAQKTMRDAVELCPDLIEDKEWLLEWLAGAAMDPRVDNPAKLIDTVFNNLPSEIAALEKYHNKAVARYHTASAFSEYYNRNYIGVRPHVLPALLGDPALFLNKGFLRLALQALLSSGN